jgi:glycosyltransferase involved in cell wall biosynthesis
MKKILFIAPHRPGRAPSQRFRYEQYLETLKEKGYEYKLSYLISEKDDRYFYNKGKFFYKAFLLFRYFFRRVSNVIEAHKYDFIFVQREAFFIGGAFFEFLFSWSKAKLIYDFDDSIWLKNVSDANRNLDWMKSYSKTKRIIKKADIVIAGNQYLAEYAMKYSKNVKIIPTIIDTSKYRKNTEKQMSNKKICIGWSGSFTTIQHFKGAESFLEKLKEKYGERLTIKVIGDAGYRNKKLDIQGLSWNKEEELHQLQSFDIGIMPLPDDQWAKGKCGLKGLQFMALEIPTIMSPVGVNTEIIQDGVNGFLARSDNEWIDKLSCLIEDESLRRKIGKNGRITVEEKYSVNVYKEAFLEIFK